jgi:hypothetical protein
MVGVVEVTVEVVEDGMSVEVVDVIAPPTIMMLVEVADVIAPPTIMVLVTMMSMEVVDVIAPPTIMTQVTMAPTIATVQPTTVIRMASKIIHLLELELVLHTGVAGTVEQKRKRM